MTGKPPDMDLTAYDKDRQTGAKVGVGWTQDDGSIAIVLNPGTALIYQPNMSYKIKPRAVDTSQGMPLPGEQLRPQRAGWKNPERVVPLRSKNRDPLDDDIPF